ncbi:MAG: GNAT family N-acetyltransferase [Anaerorhabdus sp.]|uniref:GNAT family N-acetyltransferase n=1 Tax=Anaerorhabdus sp. TaxID=1872524 RepID=UPI002FC624B7
MNLVENKLTVNVLNDIRASVGWMRLDIKQLQVSLDNTFYALEIVEDNKTVATGRIIGDGAFYLSIVDVIVHSDYQNRGLGKFVVNHLIEKVRENMKANDYPRCTINIVAAANKKGFYEKLGFIDIQEENTGTGMQLCLVR